MSRIGPSRQAAPWPDCIKSEEFLVNKNVDRVKRHGQVAGCLTGNSSC
jgi:hypothetical protein